MMLDFYGIQLISGINGKLVRSNDWEKRLQHLNKYVITRRVGNIITLFFIL